MYLYLEVLCWSPENVRIMQNCPEDNKSVIIVNSTRTLMQSKQHVSYRRTWSVRQLIIARFRCIRKSAFSSSSSAVYAYFSCQPEMTCQYIHPQVQLPNAS